MAPTFLPLLTFLAVVTAVAGVYSIVTDLFLRDLSRMGQRVDVEFLKRQRDRSRKSALFKDPGQFVVDVAAQDDPHASLRVRFDALIEQSGLDLTPGRLLIQSAAVGLAAGVLAAVLTRSPVVVLAAVLIGAGLPLLHVRRVRSARLEKLLGQLPEAFEMMSRVVRAGQTIPQALQAVADEFQPPLASEFAFCYEQQNLGLTTEAALRDLSRRTGLLEVKIFVLALLVQQQTGGNLAELLDKLSTVIRDRFRIRGQIRTLTAEGRIQAAVLLVLPLLMFAFILLFNREYANILLARPRLVAGCVVGEAIGAFWIKRITNFDF